MEKLEQHGAVVSYNDRFIPVIRPERELPQYTGRKSVEISNGFDLLLISTRMTNTDEWTWVPFPCQL